MLFPEPAVEMRNKSAVIKAKKAGGAYDFHGSTIGNRASSILQIYHLE
jgi:hypothetical protein